MRFPEGITDRFSGEGLGRDTSAAPYIECRDLFKIYKRADLEVVALRGVDLEVEKGEMIAIVGASGSGKTTLLNILSGRVEHLGPGAGPVPPPGVGVCLAGHRKKSGPLPVGGGQRRASNGHRPGGRLRETPPADGTAGGPRYG